MDDVQGGGSVVGNVDGVAEQFDKGSERCRRILVVVDHQHTVMPLGFRRAGNGRSLDPAGGTERQRHEKLGAFAMTVTLGAHGAAMELDDPFDHRQSETEPPARPCKRLLALFERLEEATQQLGVEPDPTIAHADLNGRTGGAQRQRHLSARRGKLRRILEQVSDDLRETRRVALDPRLRSPFVIGAEPSIPIGATGTPITA